MISVGNRDANKGLGLGLGFGGGGREMEETELEEGEACSYNNNDNNNDDYDASIDPDIALSYIDEKLQHVLGHFQKDFEGGVSAENLGAKFGGYGSFLPTHQRSPVWSHPKSPPKVQNHNAPPKSPNNLQWENGHRGSAVLSAAPPSLRPGPASSSTSLPALKAPSVNDSLKEEISITSSHAEEYAARHESVNKRNLADQKTLKVRIKVGSDNLSTQKNAEIYSGLGLDVSPSSSLDDSPSESEGLDHEPQDAPFESPTNIIRVMTSFPVHEGPLLSPLPDYLIHLTEKEKLLKDSRFVPFPRADSETAHSLLNGSDSRKGDEKTVGEKKQRTVEKNKFSTEFRSGINRDASSGLVVTPKKEVDIDTLACEEIVTETLKLPLLSNSYSNVVDMTKGTSRASDISREACKNAMRDTVSALVKEESSRPMSTGETGWDEKLKAGSTGKIWEDKKTSSADDVAVYPSKDGYCKKEKNLNSVKAESNVLMTRKAVDTELIDPPKQKTNQRVTSQELDGKLPPGKEHQSSGVKKKSKGSQSHGSVAELPKESSKVSSSSVSKNKKSARAENYMNKRETENRLPKDIEKVEDRYREFFGDVESEQEEKKMILLDLHSEDRPNNCGVVHKSASTLNNASKERSSGKRADKYSTLEMYPKLLLSGAPPRGPGPVSDAAQATTAPVLIEENWVCCDKCQKWRLLPLGTNPDNLPEKWLCSMLSWLPGMNRCSVSEEETTKALIAQYQVPGPESQNNLQINPGGVFSSVNLADVQHPDRNYRNFSSHALSHGGKKKHGLKEISSAYKDGAAQLPNSMKKNIQASVRSESLNDMCHSPLASELDVRQLSKSSDLSAEKHKYKHKEKHKTLEHNSDGGDTKSLKMKSKRDPDRESFRASKKSKTEDLNVAGEDWMLELAGAPGKGGPSLSNGLPTASSGKEQSRHNDYSSKDSKSDTKDRPHVSAKKQKDKVKVSVDDATAKKRKMDGLDNQIYVGSLPSTDNDIQGSRNSMEEFSDNDCRKEKKARVSKSEGKESSVSRGSGKSDKKGCHTKKRHLGPDVGSVCSQRSLDGLDNKRYSGPVQPSVAATSSSSKVSGSHKNKGSFHEAKGSPVESVSSSPMRLSARRNLNGKNESHDTEFLGIVSPGKCPYDEDEGGSDRSGTAKKDKSIVAQHMSLESSMLDMQDKDFSLLSGVKTKAIVPSPDIANRHLTNGSADFLSQDTQQSRKPPTVEQSCDEERRNDSRHHANGSRPRKSSKGSSSRSKDKSRSSKSDSVYEVQDHLPSDEVKPRDCRNRFQEKFGVKPDENEKRYVDKKDSGGNLCSEDSKRENQSSIGGHGGPDAICGRDAMSTPKQNLLQDCNGERSSKVFISDKTDQVELVSGRGKSLSLPPSGGAQNETLVRCPRPAHGSHKGVGSDILAADGSQVDEASKVPKQIRKADHHNGSQHIGSRLSSQNGHRARDPDAPSPARKDSSSQAANNALKEAKDLKHLADRLKNSGSNSESTGFYFQAALKFLHGASLLESSSSESAKHGDLLQSITIYSSTAKLCEFCAHEYERSKDMAAAALAYKCMEVAYMRVIYSSHSSASRDRHELQTSLQMAPPGESPSSSASDVENLNHPTTLDKVALPKGVSSPQVTGNHVIAARNRPNFSRLLNFAQDVNFAMEASRKSRNAFAAAGVSLGEGQNKEGISSIKRALDFNFQDVEGLLRLVRLAMEAISR